MTKGTSKNADAPPPCTSRLVTARHQRGRRTEGKQRPVGRGGPGGAGGVGGPRRRSIRPSAGREWRRPLPDGAFAEEQGHGGGGCGRWEEASAAGGQTSVTAEPHRVAGRGSDGHSLPHPRIDKTNPSIKPSPQQNRAEKRAGVVRFGKGVGGHSTSRRTICSPGDKF